MDTTREANDPLVPSLREHVLEPLSTAERAVEEERTEVNAEQKAYTEFKQRVAGIETVTMPADGPGPAARTPVVETRSRQDERLRNAFRQTVMSVDHYEAVYGEPLEEHAARELSAEVAAPLRQDTTTRFTELYKTALTSAVEDAVSDREAFCDRLDDELASLVSARESLADRIDSIDGTSVFAHDRPELSAELDAVAQARQETIQGRNHSPRADGHDLCHYLYRDYSWTYPVLTAVARFRNATV